MNPQVLTVSNADTGQPRRELVERGMLLAWAGTAWLVIAGPLAFVAGLLGAAAALSAFGLLVAVEGIGTAAILLGSTRRSGLSAAHQRWAERLIALQFLALGPLAAFNSVHVLLADEHADVSALGMAIATFSLVALVGLGRAAARIGRQLDSSSLRMRARTYEVFGYLAAAVLLSLLGSAVVGLWIADPLVALAIAATALAGGIGYWRGEIEVWTPEAATTPTDGNPATENHHRQTEGPQPR